MCQCISYVHSPTSTYYTWWSTLLIFGKTKQTKTLKSRAGNTGVKFCTNLWKIPTLTDRSRPVPQRQEGRLHPPTSGLSSVSHHPSQGGPGGVSIRVWPDVREGTSRPKRDRLSFVGMYHRTTEVVPHPPSSSRGEGPYCNRECLRVRI